jgi:hypothetical protein
MAINPLSERTKAYFRERESRIDEFTGYQREIGKFFLAAYISPIGFAILLCAKEPNKKMKVFDKITIEPDLISDDSIAAAVKEGRLMAKAINKEARLALEKYSFLGLYINEIPKIVKNLKKNYKKTCKLPCSFKEQKPPNEGDFLALKLLMGSENLSFAGEIEKSLKDEMSRVSLELKNVTPSVSALMLAARVWRSGVAGGLGGMNL